MKWMILCVKCVHYHLFIFMQLYIRFVYYVISLFLASLCYFLATRLIFYNIPLRLFFVLYFCCLFYVFCYFVLFCVLFLISCRLLPIFFTCLPTTATEWKPNCSKYRIISYHIISYHIIPYYVTLYHIISYIILHHIMYHIISYMLSSESVH